MKKNYLLIFFIFILFGLCYRLVLTQKGNFIFNMDNARDFVDVREMVVLGKLRLTGPTSAVDGFYNGPIWYYLLAIPFVLSGGHPYAAIILMIIFWAIGGFFLLKLSSRYGMLSLLSAGLIWNLSNFITLSTLYSFNPNPVLLLMPLFIYLLEKYLLTEKSIYSLLLFFLAGVFFNLEMNFGIFLPVIIILTFLLTNKANLIRNKTTILGALLFVLTLFPQVIFDLKHQLIMSKSLLNFLRTPSLGHSFNLTARFSSTADKFHEVFQGTFGNSTILTNTLIFFGLVLILKTLLSPRKKVNYLLVITILTILVPFLSFILLPVAVNSWHIGGAMAAAVLLAIIIISRLMQTGLAGKILAVAIFILICSFVITNLSDFLRHYGQNSSDVSTFQNELRAVDYVYQQAQGRNFKVYTYMPSIIDYPYQYLFWWRGLTKYGYLPKDYAYLPNQPPYISNKDLLKSPKSPQNGNFIFLIKEPDRLGIRHLWENSFRHLPLISTEKVGPLIVEIRGEK